jgi:hypothetical protein
MTAPRSGGAPPGNDWRSDARMGRRRRRRRRRESRQFLSGLPLCSLVLLMSLQQALLPTAASVANVEVGAAANNESGVVITTSEGQHLTLEEVCATDQSREEFLQYLVDHNPMHERTCCMHAPQCVVLPGDAAVRAERAGFGARPCACAFVRFVCLMSTRCGPVVAALAQ